MYEKINKSALITLLVVLHHLPTSPALSLPAIPSNTLHSKKAGSFQCIDHHPLFSLQVLPYVLPSALEIRFSKVSRAWWASLDGHFLCRSSPVLAQNYKQKSYGQLWWREAILSKCSPASWWFCSSCEQVKVCSIAHFIHLSLERKDLVLWFCDGGIVVLGKWIYVLEKSKGWEDKGTVFLLLKRRSEFGMTLGPPRVSPLLAKAASGSGSLQTRGV